MVEWLRSTLLDNEDGITRLRQRAALERSSKVALCRSENDSDTNRYRPIETDTGRQEIVLFRLVKLIGEGMERTKNACGKKHTILLACKSCVVKWGQMVTLSRTGSARGTIPTSPSVPLNCWLAELARQHCVTEVIYCNTVITKVCNCYFGWLYWCNRIRGIVHFIVYGE